MFFNCIFFKGEEEEHVDEMKIEDEILIKKTAEEIENFLERHYMPQVFYIRGRKPDSRVGETFASISGIEALMNSQGKKLLLNDNEINNDLAFLKDGVYPKPINSMQAENHSAQAKEKYLKNSNEKNGLGDQTRAEEKADENIDSNNNYGKKMPDKKKYVLRQKNQQNAFNQNNNDEIGVPNGKRPASKHLDHELKQINVGSSNNQPNSSKRVLRSRK